MERNTATISWRDVYWSTAVVAAGWTLAFSGMWWERLNSWANESALSVLLGGLAIGIAQWLVTSRRFSASAWWMLAYSAGWAAGLWAGFRWGFFSPNPLTMGGVGGAIVGVMQAVALKPYIRGIGPWIPASVVISVLGCWAGVAAGTWAYNHGTKEANAYLLGSALCGVIIGFLTSVVLRRLTNRARS